MVAVDRPEHAEPLIRHTPRAIEATVEHMETNDQSLVRRGWWMYDGSVRCEVRIVRRDVFPGTGDCEDVPDVANDREITCFELIYSTPAGPPRYGSGGYFLTVEEASDHAAALTGQSLAWE